MTDMVTFNITDERWQEVADELNWKYNTIITVKMLKRLITNSFLLVEIAEDTYSDTSPREELIEIISERLTGWSWPSFGTSEKKTEEFMIRAKKAGLIK